MITIFKARHPPSSPIYIHSALTEYNSSMSHTDPIRSHLHARSWDTVRAHSAVVYGVTDLQTELFKYFRCVGTHVREGTNSRSSAVRGSVGSYGNLVIEDALVVTYFYLFFISCSYSVIEFIFLVREIKKVALFYSIICYLVDNIDDQKRMI